MAEKIFDTRLQLKIDTWENWKNSSLVLKDGEVGFVRIPAETGEMTTEPTILFKVGDGENLFKDLPWPSALAGDVHEWAKAPERPTYAAADITGIDAYIAAYVNDQMGISVDTDTQYQIVKVDNYNYKLQSKGKADAAWADVSTIVIPNDEAAIAAALKAGQDAAAAVTAEETRAKKAEESNAAAAKAAQDAADAAQGDVDALAEKVGEIPAGATATTVVGYIDEKMTAASGDISDLQQAVEDIEADYQTSADKTELQGKIDTEKGRVDTLVGTDTGKSVRTIANEELAAQLVPANAAEALNTLEEIAAWIQAHPGDASAMNAAIIALQNKVDTGDKNVSVYVADAIAALNIGNYALAADLTALAGRVSTLEGKAHEHANAEELDKIAIGDKAKWDAAEQNAKDYADDLNTAMDGRMDAAEDAIEGLHAVANSGNVNDLVQTEGDVIVFYCGTATEVI